MLGKPESYLVQRLVGSIEGLGVCDRQGNVIVNPLFIWLHSVEPGIRAERDRVRIEMLRTEGSQV